MDAPKLNEQWRFKRNRGSGTFTVVRVSDVRVTLRDTFRGEDKVISLRTLRRDYERAS
jgi:hypothetical protein